MLRSTITTSWTDSPVAIDNRSGAFNATLPVGEGGGGAEGVRIESATSPPSASTPTAPIAPKIAIGCTLGIVVFGVADFRVADFGALCAGATSKTSVRP